LSRDEQARLGVSVGHFLHRTVTGRRIYAAGANPVAADHALVRITVLWMVVFAISPLSGVVVGVLLAGFSGTGDANVGNPYLFTSLAAVIVGGTALIGARGDYWRTVVGALVLTELSSIQIGHGFDQADQQILYGVVILLVVPAYGRARRAADRV
jgi:ribose transport system permease protein